MQIKAKQNLNVPTVLFLIFLVLKLTDLVDWSWVWVTSPLWIAFSILFIKFIFAYYNRGV